MSHSYWRVIAAIGCLAFGSNALAQTPDTPDSHSAREAVERYTGREQGGARQSENPPPEIAVRLVQEPNDKAREDAEKREARQHETADLAAQKEAASAATESAIWSRYSVWWAGLGSVATFAAAILAALAWHNSAKALRITIQGQRAHILLEDTVGGDCFGYPPKDAVFGFRIANHGESPAWIKTIDIECIVGDLPAAPPILKAAERRIIIAPPNSKSQLYGEDLILPEGFKWSDTLYVTGRILYRDVYTERESAFLYKFLPHGGADNNDIMVPWGGEVWWKYT